MVGNLPFYFIRIGGKLSMKCRKCRGEIPDGSRFCMLCGVAQNIRQNPKGRGNGQGSVYQLPNKKWIAVRTIGYEPAADGTMRRITRSKSGFRTKKEAVEYLPLVGREHVPPLLSSSMMPGSRPTEPESQQWTATGLLKSISGPFGIRSWQTLQWMIFRSV